MKYFYLISGLFLLSYGIFKYKNKNIRLYVFVGFLFIGFMAIYVSISKFFGA